MSSPIQLSEEGDFCDICKEDIPVGSVFGCICDRCEKAFAITDEEFERLEDAISEDAIPEDWLCMICKSGLDGNGYSIDTKTCNACNVKAGKYCDCDEWFYGDGKCKHLPDGPKKVTDDKNLSNK
jgi:hypothetical protein